MKRTVFVSLFLLGAVTPPMPAAEKEEEKAAPSRAVNTVVLDEAGVKNLRIETVEAEEMNFEETILCLGRIEVLPGKRAVVSSRIPGRVHSVLALPDMQCEAGDELVWVESRQPGDPPPVVRLDAPISGTIAKVNAAPGLPVSADDSLIEIHDLSTVEAAAAVPEHLAGGLRKGLKAYIRLPGFPEQTFTSMLAHLGAEADAASGTLEAAFHVENPEGLLRPGMRAEFSIVLSEQENVMTIPRAALQGEAAARFVYIKDYELEFAFVKIPVVTGALNDRFVEILSGLNPGDEVVTRGAYSLAFAGKGSVSLREALDAAHGHPHNEDGTEMTKEQAGSSGGGDGHDHDHDHGEDGGMFAAPLTKFFAATTGVLAALLIVSLVKLRPSPSSDKEAAS